ncbi:hypothetical protein FQA39_LY07926 [Lamprigera yunnana]|nr:hypothetical protein FQA39_LY07926 [Lamprigera yunnana]
MQNSSRHCCKKQVRVMGRKNNNERNSCEPPDKKPSLSMSTDDIKQGMILIDVLGKKWKLGKTIGTGGFGQIYLASDNIMANVTSDAPYVAKVENHSSGPLFVEIHCYLRISKLELINKWKEAMNMNHLAVPEYVASGSHKVNDNKYRFLILPRFEKDLEKVFEVKRKFNLKTVLTISLQIIDSLEYIHSHGYVHSDIKASNILFNEYKCKKLAISSTISKSLFRYYGFRPIRSCKVKKIQRVLRTNFTLHCVDDYVNNENSKSIDEIYLLDYGLASKYVTTNGEHKPFDIDERKAHAGTILFCSRDAHQGVSSRRSDLECLGYNLIYWLTSDLPWSKYVADPETVHRKKCTCIQNVQTFLEYSFNFDYPRFLYDYFNYLQNLEFDMTPNYKYIKMLFKNALQEYGYNDNLLLNLDGLEGWGCKQKKIKCKLDNLNISLVNSIRRNPLKSNLPVRPNLRKVRNPEVNKDWAKALADPEIIIKKAKSRERKITDSSDLNAMSGIQNLDIHALNPTAAMIEVFNKSIGKLNSNGSSPQYKGNTMDHFSRGFKILSVLNKRSKENLGTEKEGTKMLYPNKAKPKNIRILRNIYLNPNNVGQETSVILNVQDDISKCGKISEGSELSLAIRNLQAECAKMEKLWDTDDDGNLNTIAEIVQAVEVQSKPFGRNISIE